jgi:hypothetical protein
VRSSRWLAVAAAVTSLLATSCTDDATTPAPADEPDVELSAVSVYGRHAAVRGKVDVRIANEGASDVEVDSYQVRHPLFEIVPATDRPSTLPNDGQARIVPVAFGAPRCTATDTSGAVVALALRTADGVREVTVPLIDSDPGLARAHRLACGEKAVTDATSLDLGPDFVTGPDADGELVLRTALRLERRGPEPVVVTEMLGNILFTVRTAGAPVATLRAGQDSAAAEVVVQASRCDQHALIESKTSFTFRVFAAVGDREPVRVLVTVSQPARNALQALLDATCGP